MKPPALWLMEYALNAAWQVPVVFAAAWVAARVGRRVGPAFEHRVWVSALLLEALLPACSMRPAELLRLFAAYLMPYTSGHAAQTAQVTVIMGSGHVHSGLHMAPVLVVAVAIAYLCSLVYFAVRLGFGVGRTRGLRRRAHSITLTGDARRSYQRYADVFSVRDAAITISAEVSGPVTVGVRQPLLMLPANLLESVQTEDLDVVFAHEFAHVRRNDFAKNLAYEVLSLAVAFHPALWLTRTRIAESREVVCDALAADAVAGKQRYARSLLRLAAGFSDRTQIMKTHAIGIFDANHFSNFERRIMNLTGKHIELNGARRAATIAVGLFIGCGACASALALRMQVAAPAPAPQNAAQTPMPATFIMGVPRSEIGMPAPTIKVDLVPSPSPTEVSVNSPAPAAPSPAPMRIRVLSPAVVESPLPESAEQDPSMKVSAGMMAGNILTKVNPVYPPEAKAAKVQGSVVLKAVIGKDGAIRGLQLVSGPPELTHSAWEAVTQWTYKPYLLNGEPTEVETTITVNYTLAN